MDTGQDVYLKGSARRAEKNAEMRGKWHNNSTSLNYHKPSHQCSLAENAVGKYRSQRWWGQLNGLVCVSSAGAFQQPLQWSTKKAALRPSTWGRMLEQKRTSSLCLKPQSNHMYNQMWEMEANTSNKNRVGERFSDFFFFFFARFDFAALNVIYSGMAFRVFWCFNMCILPEQIK